MAGEFWNHDMAAAPKGVVKAEQRRFGKDTREVTRVEVEWLWLALPDGSVAKGHWVEPSRHHPAGRWAGLHSDASPIAWARYQTPAHPLEAELSDAADAFGTKDAARALILIRTSNNAHDFINFSIITHRVDGLVPAARAELAEVLTGLGQQFREGRPQSQTPIQKEA